ncbi:MAG: helix-turn-helix transcriptional regulator [Proteobacteria bacterium]|nr:helix-turn-helix transcriptional regulator [Pseudomonadota bacterium]
MKKGQDIKTNGDPFLKSLGDRVRGFRNRRGMTRKILAMRSSISERYLANLEQGIGNISISLLRQVASSLKTDMAQLINCDRQQSPDEELITKFIHELAPEDRKTALDLLINRFTPSRETYTRVALVGLRGAGKSTLGRLLQERFKIPFINQTKEIEKVAGMRISEIHELSGPATYHRLEEQALTNIFDEYSHCCIETVGSVVLNPNVFNHLLARSYVIWIRTSPEEHMSRVIGQGDLRPMADNENVMADLQQILERREPYYSKSHSTLNTSGQNVNKSLIELVEILKYHTSTNI